MLSVRRRCRSREDDKQPEGRTRAELEHAGMAGQSLTFGSPVEAGFAGEFFCAKGDQVAPVANKPSARGLRLLALRQR